MEDLEQIFSAKGPLAQSIDRYRYRPQQLEMAKVISAAMQSRKVVMTEAGTGTGKTFAYLVPALLSGTKVIISTGTRTLQDQLFDRDIPTVRAALKVPVTVALLKGRANYICHYYLDRSLKEGRFASKQEANYLQKIARFARTTSSGDKNSLPDIPENSPIWSDVTSTRDNCLGSECSFHAQCFVMEARRQALKADVVIVNHHLFFADVWLRDEGISELLPSCNTVIFDEAHQLPETASLFFGVTISSGRCMELARDVLIEARTGALDFPALQDAAEAFSKAIKDLRLTVSGETSRLNSPAIKRNRSFSEALTLLTKKLAALNGLLETQATRGEGLQRCYERSSELLSALARWNDDTDSEYVRWVEILANSLQLNVTPLSVADVFRRQIDEASRAWIFASATLSMNGNFNLYRDQLGLTDAQCVSWESPFDYSNQALLYVPRGICEPNSEGYVAAVIRASLPAIVASKGRAFCLFTSLRAMREAKELLALEFEKSGLNFPLLVQGDESKTELLRQFRILPNTVLIGSISFWQGVDVRGEALSLVIIDKLPFAAPDEPVLAARIERLKRLGRNAFVEYQLPHAAILLKQGAGRLIRDETDKGVLMICDPRLIARPYGQKILQSLPPMRVARELDEVVAFFRVEEQRSALAQAN